MRLEIERYRRDLVRAYIRGSMEAPPPADATDEQLLDVARTHALDLHHFKKKDWLPRVAKVVGFLLGVGPRSLLDIGSGRGAFLWPLLDALPDLEVTCVDPLPHRIASIEAVRRGGMANIAAICGEFLGVDLGAHTFDVVTLLEVVEHLVDPQAALDRAFELAERFVVVSVPSKPDDNPEHLHFFYPCDLDERLNRAGARRVSLEFVPGHTIAIATVARP
jgi:2-polyprenyl-3-methyl-5-hydroxy-6-metoxy-1,4-benzoquinol methylase